MARLVHDKPSGPLPGSAGGPSLYPPGDHRLYVWVHPGIVEPYRPGAVVRPSRAAEAVQALRPVRGEDRPARPLPPRVARAYGQSPPQRSRPALTCADLMAQPVVGLPPEATLADARTLLTERGFRHLPVLGKRVLSGLVSDRDLLRAAARGESDDTPLHDIMVERVLVASPTTELREAAVAMLRARVGCLPVLDGAGTPVGILTRSDLLRALEQRAPLDLWV